MEVQLDTDAAIPVNAENFRSFESLDGSQVDAVQGPIEIIFAKFEQGVDPYYPQCYAVTCDFSDATGARYRAGIRSMTWETFSVGDAPTTLVRRLCRLLDLSRYMHTVVHVKSMHSAEEWAEYEPLNGLPRVHQARVVVRNGCLTTEAVAEPLTRENSNQGVLDQEPELGIKRKL